ncbi:DUF3168 domain-containing protein [Arsenicitalea aurantiaca]|uniref:DUF3168 domain-containing protein n=1 Tax=Arsenicitalea aurantiaca TaxID=1783274 RepID=A0A433XF00_9HYPH|nr:DUF3168 domain-containing protein [Arsenicitalea aurantiaca]RUT32642.1 DUF3168 domain-containing protein [Arsenicitalea aurantiaca]
MQEAFINLLLSDADLTDLVGNAITWNTIPQGSPAPGIVLYLISSVPDYHMQGPDGLVRHRVQADIRSLDYLNAVAISRTVKALLSGYRGIHQAIRFDGIFVEAERHDSAKSSADELWHRVSIDFTVWAAAA